MATTTLYDIDRFYPEGKDYYDEPEFWFDGGSGCCPCGGPACDGSCDTYAEYRRELMAMALIEDDEDARERVEIRAWERIKADGKYTYVWFNQAAYQAWLEKQPVREDEIPF